MLFYVVVLWTERYVVVQCGSVHLWCVKDRQPSGFSVSQPHVYFFVDVPVYFKCFILAAKAEYNAIQVMRF